jgi:hypothetical protein
MPRVGTIPVLFQPIMQSHAKGFQGEKALRLFG